MRRSWRTIRSARNRGEGSRRECRLQRHCWVAPGLKLQSEQNGASTPSVSSSTFRVGASRRCFGTIPYPCGIETGLLSSDLRLQTRQHKYQPKDCRRALMNELLPVQLRRGNRPGTGSISQGPRAFNKYKGDFAGYLKFMMLQSSPLQGLSHAQAPLLQSPLRLQLRSDTHREAIVGTINSMPAIAINRAPFNFTILGLLWSQKLGFFHAGRYIDPDVQPWWKHVIIQHRLPRQRWLE